MINCATRICVKLHVWSDDHVVRMHCVRLKITSKSAIVNRAIQVILGYDVKPLIFVAMYHVDRAPNVRTVKVRSSVLAVVVWLAIRTTRDVDQLLNV